MLRKLGFLLGLIVAPALLSAQVGQKNNNLIDTKVEALLKRMTVEEKVGQMTQVTLEVVSVKNADPRASHQLDPKKLEAAIQKYHVGSILNVTGSAYTLDHWYEVINSVQDEAAKT